MKTIFYWVILCMIYGFTMTTLSCSDNDDNAPVLSVPQDITYTNVSSSSFTVIWTVVSGANSYTIKIKDEWGELTDKFQTVTEPTATFTGLEPEKKYWIAINATYNNSSVSPFSEWKTIRMAEGVIAKEFASGAGIANLPFIIKTPGQLKLMAYLVNKSNENKENISDTQSDIEIKMDPTIDYSKAYYELGDDIDMSEVENWTPIGTGLDNEQIQMPEKNMFKGHFDGKGHTIKNFTINYLGNEPHAIYGLFGLTGPGCTISNLNVESDISTIHTGTEETANYLVIGGIIAYSYRTTISNCTFKGNIHASFSSDIYGTAMVGGICGNMSGELINNCMVEIPISNELVACGNSPQVGAILGYGNRGSIQYCSAIINGSILAETKPINPSAEASLYNSSAFAGGICGSSSGAVIGGCEIIINGTLHAISKKPSKEANINTIASAGGVVGSYGADILGNCNILITGSVKAEADNMANAGGAVGIQTRAGYGASSLHATISGEIIANVNSGVHGGSDASYAGGIYGTGSFQSPSGSLQDSDVTIKGKVIATHPQMAMSGGIAGSMMTLIRCWTVIDKDGLLEAKGGVAGASCGGITGNLLNGNIYGSYTICKGLMNAEAETATGRNTINMGGIAGVANGNRLSRRILTGCYSLIEGTMSATGPTTFIGGIAGLSSNYTTMNATYWWSASDAITGHSGAMGTSDTFKIPDTSQASLEEAAQNMNTPLDNYGYFFYREKDKYLNITTKLQ